MAKTNTEKIADIQEQIAQLENRQKRLIQQQKEQERKDRTSGGGAVSKSYTYCKWQTVHAP